MELQNIPHSERPRERCLAQGPECLSLRELLAVILGSGVRGSGCLSLAGSLLTRPGHGLDPIEEERAYFTAMEVSPIAHLQDLPGIGAAHRARLLAAFEIGRRYSAHRLRRIAPHERTRKMRVVLPERAIDRVGPILRNDPQEWLGFVPLHRNGELGQFCMVERGVRTHVNIDPIELFARVLSLRPAGFFLFHNHPSGNLEPSPEDCHLTRQVQRLAEQLSLRLLGHGILGSQGERWIVI